LCGEVTVAHCEVVVVLEAEGPAVDQSVKRRFQRRHLTLTLTPHHHIRTSRFAISRRQPENIRVSILDTQRSAGELSLLAHTMIKRVPDINIEHEYD
jgi:hypothetical protein